jgi:hypothetical protein
MRNPRQQAWPPASLTFSTWLPINWLHSSVQVEVGGSEIGSPKAVELRWAVEPPPAFRSTKKSYASLSSLSCPPPSEEPGLRHRPSADASASVSESCKARPIAGAGPTFYRRVWQGSRQHQPSSVRKWRCRRSSLYNFLTALATTTALPPYNMLPSLAECR